VYRTQHRFQFSFYQQDGHTLDAAARHAAELASPQGGHVGGKSIAFVARQHEPQQGAA
jgi:hypothetical protein